MTRRRTRGAVTLVFDDGYRAVYDLVLPLLRRYGLRAVFAVPVDTSALERAEGAPVSDLRTWKIACEKDGHELAAHGVTHRALTTLLAGDLRAELARSREVTSATTLVYPGGAHDDRVVAEARSRFQAARTVLRGFETLPPRDPFRLRSFVSRRDNFRVWAWNLRALWAWLAGQWMIEVFHNVSSEKEERRKKNGGRDALHTVPLAGLERHLRFVKRLPIRVATIREVVQEVPGLHTSEARFGSV